MSRAFLKLYRFTDIFTALPIYPHPTTPGHAHARIHPGPLFVCTRSALPPRPIRRTSHPPGGHPFAPPPRTRSATPTRATPPNGPPPPVGRPWILSPVTRAPSRAHALRSAHPSRVAHAHAAMPVYHALRVLSRHACRVWRCAMLSYGTPWVIMLSWSLCVYRSVRSIAIGCATLRRFALLPVWSPIAFGPTWS